MDEAIWRALYVNEPIEREDLSTMQMSLDGILSFSTEPDTIIGVCDTKDKGKDYCFLPVGYVYGEDYYIDDCVCDNGLPDVVDARLVEILVRDKVKSCRFESNSAGGRIAKKGADGREEQGRHHSHYHEIYLCEQGDQNHSQFRMGQGTQLVQG